MTTACYFFAYLFETLISYIYFGHKFESKLSGKALTGIFAVSLAIQYAVSFLGIPNINLLTFFICNFLLCLVCYDSGILRSILNSILLASIMLVTELCILYVFKAFFRVDISEHCTNSTVLLLQSICTKLFYFFILYIILKFSSKEEGAVFKFPTSYLLFLLPIASIFLLFCFYIQIL